MSIKLIKNFEWLNNNYPILLVLSFLSFSLVLSNFGLLRIVSSLYLGSAIFKGFIIVSLVTSFIYLTANHDSIKIDLFTFLISYLIIYSTIFGFFHEASLRFLFSHTTAGIIIFCFYMIGNCADWKLNHLNNICHVFSYFSLLVYSVLLLIFWTMYFLGESKYIGLSCSFLLLPISIFLCNKNYIAFIITFILILLSGKRGVFLGACTISIIFFIINSNRSWKRIICLVVILFIFFLTTYYFSEYFNRLPILGTIFNKFSLLLSFHDFESLSKATSGRSTELLSAWHMFKSQPIYFVTGMGFGWHIEWASISDPSNIIKANYVHNSFLNYFFQYGPVFSTALILLLIYKPILLIIDYKYHGLPRDLLWIPTFLLGEIVTAQTSYLLVGDILFWILLGLSSQIHISQTVK